MTYGRNKIRDTCYVAADIGNRAIECGRSGGSSDKLEKEWKQSI